MQHCNCRKFQDDRGPSVNSDSVRFERCHSAVISGDSMRDDVQDAPAIHDVAFMAEVYLRELQAPELHFARSGNSYQRRALPFDFFASSACSTQSH